MAAAGHDREGTNRHGHRRSHLGYRLEAKAKAKAKAANLQPAHDECGWMHRTASVYLEHVLLPVDGGADDNECPIQFGAG